MNTINATRALVKRHPMIFGVSVTTAKTCSVDLFVQKYVEKKEVIDWRRNMTFGVFGMITLGVWQYYLYNKIFPIITPGTFKFAKRRKRG